MGYTLQFSRNRADKAGMSNLPKTPHPLRRAWVVIIKRRSDGWTFVKDVFPSRDDALAYALRLRFRKKYRVIVRSPWR